MTRPRKDGRFMGYCQADLWITSGNATVDGLSFVADSASYVVKCILPKMEYTNDCVFSMIVV